LSFVKKSKLKEKTNSPLLTQTPKKSAKIVLFEERDLATVHESLVNQILNEEESILEFHRRKIESTTTQLSVESTLLKEVETPGSQIDTYISKLDALLISQIQQANTLRKMLGEFQQHLKEEEELNKQLKNE
jgi:kinesin family protein 2/24